MAAVEKVSYEEELKRNPELKESDIQILREWCAKQPHLPKIADNTLACFLHSNYYRIEPTKSTIDTFYTIRSHVPEFFANRDPLGNKDLRAMFSVTAHLPLGTTPEGYRILYDVLINTDSSVYMFHDDFKYWNMVNELYHMQQGTVPGHIVVVDLRGMSFGHTTRVTPMGLKKLVCYIQDALPVRLKAVHVIRSSPFIEIVLRMAKPFIKKELLDILYFHTTDDTAAKFFSLELLPNESGGKAGPLMELHEKNIKWIESNRDWFLHEEATGRVDESLRPGKGKNATDLFGAEGSFKKLDID